MALSMRIFFFSMISGLFSKSWSPSQRWTIRYIIAIVWSSLAAATQRYKHFKCSETDCTAQQCWHTMYKWWTLFEACANFQLERELYFICISVEKRVPWIGIGAGAVFGMIIVILDIFFTKKPTLSVRDDTPQFIQMSQFIFQWTIRFSFSSIRFWWF